jgi:hypothetical protein
MRVKNGEDKMKNHWLILVAVVCGTAAVLSASFIHAQTYDTASTRSNTKPSKALATNTGVSTSSGVGSSPSEFVPEYYTSTTKVGANSSCKKVNRNDQSVSCPPLEPAPKTLNIIDCGNSQDGVCDAKSFFGFGLSANTTSFLQRNGAGVKQTGCWKVKVDSSLGAGKLFIPGRTDGEWDNFIKAGDGTRGFTATSCSAACTAKQCSDFGPEPTVKYPANAAFTTEDCTGVAGAPCCTIRTGYTCKPGYHEPDCAQDCSPVCPTSSAYDITVISPKGSTVTVGNSTQQGGADICSKDKADTVCDAFEATYWNCNSGYERNADGTGCISINQPRPCVSPESIPCGAPCGTSGDELGQACPTVCSDKTTLLSAGSCYSDKDNGDTYCQYTSTTCTNGCSVNKCNECDENSDCDDAPTCTGQVWKGERCVANKCVAVEETCLDECTYLGCTTSTPVKCYQWRCIKQSSWIKGADCGTVCSEGVFPRPYEPKESVCISGALPDAQCNANPNPIVDYGVPDGSPCNRNSDCPANLCLTLYTDSDHDGHGSLAARRACYASVPSGDSSSSGDCNDNNPNIRPGATEKCNGVDDNCDGSIDEGCPAGSDPCEAVVYDNCDLPKGQHGDTEGSCLTYGSCTYRCNNSVWKSVVNHCE